MTINPGKARASISFRTINVSLRELAALIENPSDS